jgi:hypothetical protein
VAELERWTIHLSQGRETMTISRKGKNLGNVPYET